MKTEKQPLKKVTDLGVKEVIHCKTELEDLSIRNLMHEAGLRWWNGKSYSNTTFWYGYKSNTCHIPRTGACGNLTHHQSLGYIIHPASDFLPQEEKTHICKHCECETNQPDEECYKAPQSETNFKSLLDLVLGDLRGFLLKKDSEYGSLYLNPLNVLISSPAKDRILCRLEEKIGRLVVGKCTDDNTLDDILGLLVHLKVIDKANHVD